MDRGTSSKQYEVIMDFESGKPRTLNEILRLITSLKNKLENNESLIKLNELENSLINMKRSPELQNNCNIDIKISNPDFYVDKLKKIMLQK